MHYDSAIIFLLILLTAGAVPAVAVWSTSAHRAQALGRRREEIARRRAARSQ